VFPLPGSVEAPFWRSGMTFCRISRNGVCLQDPIREGVVRMAKGGNKIPATALAVVRTTEPTFSCRVL
jgi:hypothetical protein